MNSRKLWTACMLVFVSMAGLIVGFDTGTIGGIENMSDFKARFANIRHSNGDLSYTAVRNGLLVAIVNVGTLIGAGLSSIVADRVGERRALILFCAIFMIGNLVQITTTTHWYQLTIGRIIVGIAMGAQSVVAPVFQSECAPRDLRGAIVASYHVSTAAGALIANLIQLGSRNIQGSASWRLLFGLQFLWCSILLSGMLFLPESPRYLVSQGRDVECVQVLENIYGEKAEHDSMVELEFVQIQEAATEERLQGKATWSDFFKSDILRRTALGVLIMALQQLQGYNYFMYYATTIFKEVGVQNPYIASIISNAVNFSGCVIAAWLIDLIGRRKPLMCGGVWNSMCLLVFASVGWKHLYPNGQSDGQANHTAGIIMIAFTCLFILGFGLSWAATAWVIMSESYPQKFRSKCSSIVSTGFWTTNFLIGFFTPFIKNAIGFRFGYIFAACALLGAVVIFLSAKETKGLTLEEITVLYESPVKPWKSAAWGKRQRELRTQNSSNDTPPIQIRTDSDPGLGTSRSKDDAMFDVTSC